MFLEMVRSVFALDHSVPLLSHLEMGGASQLQVMPTSCRTGNDVVPETIETALAKVTKKAGLVATDTWLAKVKEILTMVRMTKRHSEQWDHL